GAEQVGVGGGAAAAVAPLDADDLAVGRGLGGGDDGRGEQQQQRQAACHERPLRRRTRPIIAGGAPGARDNDAMLTVDPPRVLDRAALVTEFARRRGEEPASDEVTTLLASGATAPLRSDDEVREKVRALLRQGGFKPTGRSKPASEYLLRTATDRPLPPINL